MTDSLAYLVGLVALYAIVLAVERPTWRRQLAVPAAVLVAYLVRPQFAVLYPHSCSPSLLSAGVVCASSGSPAP